MPRDNPNAAAIQATPPMIHDTPAAPNNAPVDCEYATMISGKLTRPDACCAAAVDFTLADNRSTSDRVSARNGGTTQSISTHHCAAGKNHPPTCGPTMVFPINA